MKSRFDISSESIVPIGTGRNKNCIWSFRFAAICLSTAVCLCCGWLSAEAQTTPWAWTSGSPTANQAGAPGTRGIAAAANVPGGRVESVTWTDGSGDLWLYGGEGVDSAGVSGNLADMWKFNTATSEWTWVGGSTLTDHTVGAFAGVYGTQGLPGAGNNPGTRDAAIGWTDNNGNFWLFGGYGVDGNGSWGFFDDMWEFNPGTNQWTWMTGSNTIGSQGGQTGNYGAPGTGFPGSRIWALSWTDPTGGLWLFGGYGVDGAGNGGLLNDLWKFNPTTATWNWVSGSSNANEPGTYGSLNKAAASNVPGGRYESVYWSDPSGNLWLYGGEGYDSSGINGNLGDLWKFNTATEEWTWVFGSNVTNHVVGAFPGVYGTKGVPASANSPGSRDAAIGWTDSSGNLWLFGGYGIDTTGASGLYDDLWEFVPYTGQWTWVSGNNTISSTPGAYGVLGVANASNLPGSRVWASGWTDSAGNLWLFGGYGYDGGGQGSGGFLNDLWRY